MLRGCIYGSVMEMNFLQPSPWYNFTGASMNQGIGDMICVYGLWRPRTAIWWFRVPVMLNMSPRHINSHGSSRAICPIII
jgi:hypothetical protein